MEEMAFWGEELGDDGSRPPMLDRDWGIELTEIHINSSKNHRSVQLIKLYISPSEKMRPRHFDLLQFLIFHVWLLSAAFIFIPTPEGEAGNHEHKPLTLHGQIDSLSRLHSDSQIPEGAPPSARPLRHPSDTLRGSRLYLSNLMLHSQILLLQTMAGEFFGFVRLLVEMQLLSVSTASLTLPIPQVPKEPRPIGPIASL